MWLRASLTLTHPLTITHSLTLTHALTISLKNATRRTGPDSLCFLCHCYVSHSLTHCGMWVTETETETETECD